MNKMIRFVSREEIQKARKQDMYRFMLDNHGDMVIREGICLKLKCNESIYLKKDIPGFHDFATGEHGNSVDFLLRYLNYESFQEAVIALLYGEASVCRVPEELIYEEEPRKFALPVPAEPPFKRVYAYLHSRAIPGDLINRLFSENILYQDSNHGNAVFVNPERDYFETRGTLTVTANAFHGCGKVKSNKFWYISDFDHPQIAYVCEAAIDALSLYLLYDYNKLRVPAVFISIGGVSNQATINRIKERIPTVLAVDNDAAGHNCRLKNMDIPAFFPSCKDWNEDLQKDIKPLLYHPYPYQMSFYV